MDKNEFLAERYHLSLERITEIPNEIQTIQGIEGSIKQYFLTISEWIGELNTLRNWFESHSITEKTFEEWQEIFEKLYRPLRNGYSKSYANPVWAEKKLGCEYGRLLSFLASEIYRIVPQVFMGHLEALIVLQELFVEIYTSFVYEGEECRKLPAEEIRKNIYWAVSDYSDEMVLWRVREQQEPGFSPILSIIMDEDLSDLRYLFKFGAYISDSEIQTAQHMNELSQEKIDAMADTFVQGYIRGFEIYKIPLDNKKYVSVRGSIGFERVLRSAVVKFRQNGLEPIFFPAATTIINRRQVMTGYQGCSINPQYIFDHCKDKAVYYDRPLANRYLGALRKAYETCDELIRANAGPACFETFGEKPFTPEVHEACWHLSAKQQKLEMEFAGMQAELTEEYMKSDEISFTIIAFPTPQIGTDYKEIFDAVVEVNTLDNDTYYRIQQKIIDVLDTSDYAYVRGKYPNKTIMKVHLRELRHPEKETKFENCCADVNIPLGEVFTSPVLKGTEGLLHVRSAYLNGIHFENLMLRFADGEIVDYNCSNTEDSKANLQTIKDYLLTGRESLPIGEFAIGTNTTAYAMARKYNITDRLPILIVEKMGPHFAIGDTCYSRSEDYAVYNPNGKEIVARDNEISARRNEEGFQAYFNCHTDITIPYDEIDEIFVVDHDENMITIIKDGRFVLEGTEELNRPLNNL